MSHSAIEKNCLDATLTLISELSVVCTITLLNDGDVFENVLGTFIVVWTSYYWQPESSPECLVAQLLPAATPKKVTAHSLGTAGLLWDHHHMR